MGEFGLGVGGGKGREEKGGLRLGGRVGEVVGEVLYCIALHAVDVSLLLSLSVTILFDAVCPVSH